MTRAHPDLTSLLELRITVDAKRIASLRDAIRRECGRAHADSDHTETVALVAEQLLDEREGAVDDAVGRGAVGEVAGRPKCS